MAVKLISMTVRAYSLLQIMHSEFEAATERGTALLPHRLIVFLVLVWLHLAGKTFGKGGSGRDSLLPPPREHRSPHNSLVAWIDASWLLLQKLDCFQNYDFDFDFEQVLEPQSSRVLSAVHVPNCAFPPRDVVFGVPVAGLSTCRFICCARGFRKSYFWAIARWRFRWQ